MPNLTSSFNRFLTLFSILALELFLTYILKEPPCVSIFSALNIFPPKFLKKFTNFNVIDWVKEVENRGAGEILLCDVDRDGLKQGLNLEIGLEAASRTSIPIIISGGCGLAKHFVDGFIYSKVEGIAAGTFFSFKDQNLMQTRSHIINAGIPIRSKT